MAYTLPQLTYDFAALEPYIDAKTMELHHGKHHAKYVENLNKALGDNQAVSEMPIGELLAKLQTVVPQEQQTSVRNNGGGHANHSLFWEIMTPGGAKEPLGELLAAINKLAGSFTNLQQQFTDQATAIFGSGWSWLVVTDGELELLTTANQDSPYLQGKTPILGLDVWEHAYYLHYQNRRPEYITAWWHVVNWDVVAANYQAANN